MMKIFTSTNSLQFKFSSNLQKKSDNITHNIRLMMWAIDKNTYRTYIQDVRMHGITVHNVRMYGIFVHNNCFG